MSVDDWALREAERRYPHRDPYLEGAAYLSEERSRKALRKPFAEGITHAFSALLSDEAVEAAAKVLAGDFEPDAGELYETRLMLQAAIDAVTKEARND